MWAAGYCAIITSGHTGFHSDLLGPLLLSLIWSHACCLMRSVRLVTIISLAVTYNTENILFGPGENKFCTFLLFGDLFSIWCSVFL